MNEPLHQVTSCRYGGLTIFLSYPTWLDSEERPWCCLRRVPPQPLDDATCCHECQNWQPRPEDTRDAHTRR